MIEKNKKIINVASFILACLLVVFGVGLAWNRNNILSKASNESEQEVLISSGGETKISAAGDEYIYTPDIYDYPNGIIVFTSADGLSPGDAGITKGDKITYSLEITNQGSSAKTIDLKFTIPKGYTFTPSTAVVTCSAGITPCGNPTPAGTITGTGTNLITWSDISVPAGMSKISFKLGT